MDKWPEGLRKDMEEIFKSSPELLEILRKEKEFEDLMNKQRFEEHPESLEDEFISSDGKKDKESAK